MADVYLLMGRKDDAKKLLDQLVALRNDVGLLSEEYDSDRRRMVGNFPQAFSHVALVNTLSNLYTENSPMKDRGRK
jgi:GH15 family glucan-1,4-alpha-glucosidase